MHLIDIIKNAESINKHPVICFTGTYPVLFVSFLLRHLKNCDTHSITTIDWQQVTVQEIKAQLSVSFLGETFVAWCSDLGQLEARQKKELFSFLATYKGPHAVWFFSAETDLVKLKHSWTVIQIPQSLDWHMFKQLFQVLFESEFSKLQPLELIFKKKGSLGFDEAALLSQYALLLSKSAFEEFCSSWLGLMVPQDQSLFELSTQFFAKNQKRFFALWKNIGGQYPAPFWLVYWSDQLFRAASFVQYSRKQEFNEAKKIAYKLPFSFIKKDWQQYTYTELAAAHDKVYALDFQIKNGGTDSWLDLFFVQFFIL
jgi:hypothetical protein